MAGFDQRIQVAQVGNGNVLRRAPDSVVPPGWATIFSSGKMSRDLRDVLVAEQLGVAVDELLIALHPHLAATYMEVLASEMAANRSLTVVSESVFNHVAAGYTTYFPQVGREI
jgi:hypothetical protein